MSAVEHLGEVCAILAPLCWSVAILLYRKVGDTASPEAMTLFKNSLATVLLLGTLGVLGEPVPTDRPLGDWVKLAASGVLGLAVADTLFFYALKRIGAARVAIIDTAYAPAVVLLSWVWLEEALSSGFLLGGVLVIGGVLLANLRRGGIGEVDPRDALVGGLFGLGAVLGTATGVILSKEVLEGSHLVEVTATRMAFGVAGQLVWTAARRDATALSAFRPSSGAWVWLLPATLLGTYVAMLLWMGGFKWAPASVAAVLNQLATVYILVLARWVLAEPVAGHQLAGGALAVVGAVVVMGGR